MAKPEGRRIYRAREGFSGTVDGVPFNVNVGQTVREGHPILTGRLIYFEEANKADFEWTESRIEMATAAPGEKR